MIDTDFKLRHGEHCVLALSGRGHDKDGCNSPGPERYLASASALIADDNFPQCTPDIPTLQAKYVAIGQELTASLDAYMPILQGSHDATSTKSELCAYSFEEIRHAYELSTKSRDALARLKETIDSANDCSDQINKWQDGLDRQTEDVKVAATQDRYQWKSSALV